jgi:hypothetical protein
MGKVAVGTSGMGGRIVMASSTFLLVVVVKDLGLISLNRHCF